MNQPVTRNLTATNPPLLMSVAFRTIAVPPDRGQPLSNAYLPPRISGIGAFRINVSNYADDVRQLHAPTTSIVLIVPSIKTNFSVVSRINCFL